MSPMQEEAVHLFNLMAEPYRKYWADYCKAKAIYLEQSDPDVYSGLLESLREMLKSTKEK